MALKGEVCIELKNVETGEVEKIEGHNMMTNAVERALDVFASTGLQTYDTRGKDNMRANMLPVCTRALGGILLFSNPLAENVNNLIVPSNNKLLAMAGRGAFTKFDGGTCNTEETGPTETGYKNVWDFSTSQANGTISALALTHCIGGAHRFSSSNSPIKFGTSSLYPDIGTYQYSTYYSMPSNTIWYDWANEYLYYYEFNKSTKILNIYKRRQPYRTFKVKETQLSTGPAELVTSLQMTMQYATNYYGGVTTNLEDKKVYFCFNNYDSSDFNPRSYPTYKYAVLDLTNMTLQEKSFSFSSLPSSIPSISTGNEINQGSGIYRDYFYCATYMDSHTYIIKINVNNNSDYTMLLLDDNYKECRAYMQLDSEGLHLRTYNSGKSVLITYNDDIYYSSLTSGDSDYGDFSYGRQISETLAISGTSNILFIAHRYLGTIFNLSSPVTKTAAQTMKIIYTLTDAS